MFRFNAQRAYDALVPAVYILTVMGLTAQASADRPQGERDARRQDAPKDVTAFMDRSLMEQVREYDWDAETPFVQRALVNVWEKNQWNTPGDEYALKLALEISQIPPWEPMKRIDLVTERVSERYDLNNTAATRLKSKIVIGMGEFIGKHGPEIVKNVREAMNGRLSGQPINPAQVKEWIERADGFRTEADALTESIIDELENMVGPRGRRAFEMDVSSYRRRMERVDQLTERWRQGKWEPSDWGLQDDPIQRGVHPGVRVGNRAEQGAGGPAIPTRWFAHEPETWIAYLAEFRATYDLSVGQSNTAESIHNEMTRRALTFKRLRRERLERIPAAEREGHPDFEPIREIFTEFQLRLDGILSDTQRQSAGG